MLFALFAEFATAVECRQDYIITYFVNKFRTTVGVSIVFLKDFRLEEVILSFQNVCVDMGNDRLRTGRSRLDSI